MGHCVVLKRKTDGCDGVVEWHGMQSKVGPGAAWLPSKRDKPACRQAAGPAHSGQRTGQWTVDSPLAIAPTGRQVGARLAQANALGASTNMD